MGVKEKAPNFVMRFFDVEPGASSPHHAHDWEREAYIPPMEEHHFVNTGDEVLRFLCLIPLLDQS